MLRSVDRGLLLALVLTSLAHADIKELPIGPDEPLVLSEDFKPTLVGPVKAEVGQLIVLDASGSRGVENYKWLAVGHSRPLYVDTGGAKAVFSAGQDGTYRFVLAAAGRVSDEVCLELLLHTVVVGQPTPEPGPGPEPSPPPPPPSRFGLVEVAQEVATAVQDPRWGQGYWRTTTRPSAPPLVPGSTTGSKMRWRICVDETGKASTQDRNSPGANSTPRSEMPSGNWHKLVRLRHLETMRQRSWKLRKVFGMLGNIIIEKLKSLLTSRRFWASMSGILVTWLQERLGLSPEAAQQIVAVLVAWIIGDSLAQTRNSRMTDGGR